MARLLRRLEALQALTDSTKQQDSDDRLELLDVMQLPRSTGNVRLACCRVMSKIYVAVQVYNVHVNWLHYAVTGQEIIPIGCLVEFIIFIGFAKMFVNI